MADAVEEHTKDMIANMTATQLLYLLQRIQQLVSHAPEKAKQLLTDNPQLSMALLDAEHIVGCKADKLLPLTSDEVRLAKERFYELRNPGATNRRSYAAASVAPSQMDQSQEVARGLAKLDPSILAAITGSSDDVLDMDSIVSQLFKLTDDQIAQLPEEVQLLLLNALQNSI